MRSDRHILLTLFPVYSVIVGLFLSGLMMLFLGQNPLIVYRDILVFAFRDIYNIADIFAKAVPLIFTGLAFGFAYRASLFNIGAQGQFYMGCLASVSCSLYLSFLPKPLLLSICLLSSLIIGGLWGSLIGYAKARFNANEFLLSLMSTYVAIAIMNFLIRGPLIEAKGEYPQTDVIAQSAWIPLLIPHTRMHMGLILALLVAAAVYFILWKTTLGYKIRAVGMNRNAARFAGIDEKKIFVSVFFISGAFAGLAGFTEVNGIQHMLVQGFNPMIGTEGIGIAILGNTHPFGIVMSALLFGALKVGGALAVQVSNISSSFLGIMEGFVMLSVIISYFVRQRIMSMLEKRRLQEESKVKAL